MYKLPDFFWADRLTPIAYYPYPSSTRDRIYEVNTNKERYEREADIQRFLDLKVKCLATDIRISDLKGSMNGWTRDVWDNKIVIECKTENNSTIYVGFYDSVYSIGLGVLSRDNRNPLPYNQQSIY